MQETLLVKRIRGRGWNHVEIKWSSREKKSRKGRWREWKIVSRSPKSAFNPYFIVRGTNEAIALFLALEIILFLFFFLGWSYVFWTQIPHNYCEHFQECNEFSEPIRQLQTAVESHRLQCNKLDKAVADQLFRYGWFWAKNYGTLGNETRIQ